MFPSGPIKDHEHKRFFMLYGAMRTGTQWLSGVLKKNVAGKVNVSHEGWRADKFAKIDDQWRNGKAELYFSVGQGGYDVWRYVQRTYRPVTAFLWRDPMDHARSILHHKSSADRSRLPFLTRMFLTFAAYEAVLAACEDDDTEVSHWHLSQYGNEAGFKVMCAELDIPLKKKLVLPQPSNRTAKRGSNTLKGIEDAVRDIYAMFPLCLDARAEALERARDAAA